MSTLVIIKQITPTVFLKKDGNALQQLIRLTVINEGVFEPLSIVVESSNFTYEFMLGKVRQGESTHEIFIDEISRIQDVKFTLRSEQKVFDIKNIIMNPPKHWTVHVVQTSHHDVGYVDLGSNILKQHIGFLDDALAMAEKSSNLPEDAKFRITIEQVWSIYEFLKCSPPERVAKMVEYIRSGRIEVTALFGNMTTEICGHEALARSLYHSSQLKRQYGFDITTANHVDITGFSWGLCQILTEADIKLLCLGLPDYYSWGKFEMQSFWNEKEVFSHKGPGAFWWEAPSGKRLLVWSNNNVAGDYYPDMPNLFRELDYLSSQDYPYSVLRWPVMGGAGRDNPPYSDRFAYAIKDWNERWVYPHLICSTNAKFYNDLIQQIPENLTVLSGELPGQDYPIGATSTAASTAINRNNHIGMTGAEKLAVAANTNTDYKYPKEELKRLTQDILWYDEHTWGHHFPCGPGMQASVAEKEVHAYRANALIHDIKMKSMAKLADNIHVEEPGIYLTIFNMSPFSKTGPVRVAMREIDNCGITMVYVPAYQDPRKVGYMQGYLRGHRQTVNPETRILDGKFNLLDVETGDIVAFQMVDITTAHDTIPYADERLGLAAGEHQYGGTQSPVGLKYDLVFVARDVQAYGYKTYKLVEQESISQYNGDLKTSKNSIENKFYKVTVDKASGGIISILDKMTGREIVDSSCTHKFNALIIREPDHAKEYTMGNVKAEIRTKGPVLATIEITGCAYGHPVVKQTVSLYAGIKQVYFETKILKDLTPLLDVHLAFPFKTADPQFKYEGALSTIEPIKDYFPGSYSDTIAIQNWVKVQDDAFNVLLSSLDAPIIGLGGLWPGYVSPAHGCVLKEEKTHPPLKKRGFEQGLDIFKHIQ